MLRTEKTSTEMEREVLTLDAVGGSPLLDVGVIPAPVAILAVTVAFVAAVRTVLAIALVAASRTLVAGDEDRSCAGVPLDDGDAKGDGSPAGWVCDSCS